MKFIQGYFLAIRKSLVHQGVSFHLLHSLIRLSEAHAALCLQPAVTMINALFAIGMP